jgi:hypothetical protein
MTWGIGSVVSPIPRLIIFASGYLSKCADLLLAIYFFAIKWQSKTSSVVKRNEEKNQKQINRWSNMTYLRKEITSLKFTHVFIARDPCLVGFKTMKIYNSSIDQLTYSFTRLIDNLTTATLSSFNTHNENHLVISQNDSEVAENILLLLLLILKMIRLDDRVVPTSLSFLGRSNAFTNANTLLHRQ